MATLAFWTGCTALASPNCERPQRISEIPGNGDGPAVFERAQGLCLHAHATSVHRLGQRLRRRPSAAAEAEAEAWVWEFEDVHEPARPYAVAGTCRPMEGDLRTDADRIKKCRCKMVRSRISEYVSLTIFGSGTGLRG